MPATSAEVVVAGHICLDVFPTFGTGGDLAHLLVPGALVEIGPALLSAGGPVANTGLALHRLGVRVRLMGKIGDDLFGDAIRRILDGYGPGLSRGMLVSPGVPSSYSIVISAPDVDRVFLHCPGANDMFGADDIPYDELAGARVFHFGYPPLMRRMYADGGLELQTIFRRVKERDLLTSLDMARPDPASPAGRADWRAILARVLPHVDVFLPSVDETLFMLDRRRFELLGPNSDRWAPAGGALLGELAETLLAMGAGVVGLKLGERGLYVRTTGQRARLAALGAFAGTALDSWLGRELLTPCFAVIPVGTTGCGDCTIAGFLTGLLHGVSLEQALAAAVAVGACNVEQADAVSGVPTWEAVQARIRSGWKKRPAPTAWAGWTWNAAESLAIGPMDATNRSA